MLPRWIRLLSLLCIASVLVSCNLRRGAIGTEGNPVRLLFMPLKGEATFAANAPRIEQYLNEKTGLFVTARQAPDFISIVKALGQKRADVAFMNTLGYLLTRDWAGAEAHLTQLYGDLSAVYRGEIIARADSPIKSLHDLTGKRIAFADPYSASGYLYAAKLLHDKGVRPGETIFAKGHRDAVQMVYDGKVDAAAVYHTLPTARGLNRDARVEIAAHHPDVISKIRVLALTEEIPNGPIAMRQGLPEEITLKLVGALMECARSAEGRQALFDLYNITGLGIAHDEDYDGVRDVLTEMGKTIQEVVPGGISFYRTYVIPGLE